MPKVRDGSIEVRERLVAVDAPQRRAYFADNTSIQVKNPVFSPIVSFVGVLLVHVQVFLPMGLALIPIVLCVGEWNRR